MTLRLPFGLLLLTASIGGCGGGASEEPTLTPQPATLAGVYAGEFPCSNCAAIEATLWLRPDNRFFLRQKLVDDSSAANASAAPSTMFALGRWQWDEAAAQAVLRGAGPERRLSVRDDNRLELRVPSPIEHLLVRDAAAPVFEDRITLDGESAVSENGATFVECLTGLSLPVADAGAYRELRRQHRRMNARGKIALTTVEGHLVTVSDGSATREQLVIDRFVTIKPGQGC
jgi:hypothetical protein